MCSYTNRLKMKGRPDSVKYTNRGRLGYPLSEKARGRATAYNRDMWQGSKGRLTCVQRRSQRWKPAVAYGLTLLLALGISASPRLARGALGSGRLETTRDFPKPIRLTAAAFLNAAPWQPPGAPAATAAGGLPALVRAQLALKPATLSIGSVGTLRLIITIPAGYHIQSAHPLDSFLVATQARVLPSAGLIFGPVHYPPGHIIPAPARITSKGELSVYTATVRLTIPVRVAKTVRLGPRRLKVRLTTQACNASSCFFPMTQQLTVETRILAAAGKSPATSRRGRRLYRVETRILAAAIKSPPRNARASRPEQRPPASITLGQSMPTQPVPQRTAGINPAVRRGAATGAAPAPNQRHMTAHRRLPLPAPPNSVAADLKWIQAQAYASPPKSLPLWQIILFALIGGVILNAMPCVLPVIPLKVLAMVQQSHGRRREALTHGLLFGAGVVSLFAALALAMGLWRAWTGKALMYGMQFRSPWFLILLGLIVLALALSMLGVWTIQPPRVVYATDPPRQGWLGSYSMGLLATVLATPCSAPYLGVVLTWALVQPTFVMVLSLGLIGVGMAIPYILLAAFPKLLVRLPRAGRWSELLKQALGIVMVAVAVYLLGSLATRHQVVVGLALAVILAALCWAWGQIPTPAMSRMRVWAIRSGAVGLGAAGAIGLVAWMGGLGGTVVTRSTAASPGGGESTTFQVNHWQSFTLPRLRSGLALGHPVVVDFTANWCINCRYVKATVLESGAVKAAFKRHRAVLLRADLTESNPVATALLEQLGGRAIPFLAIFSPWQPHRPQVLRDLYSAAAVLTAIHTAVRER